MFDIDKHDGLLSVLPLHHTFEFTAGLLMPLMRGAQITYLDEIDADALAHAFESGNITGMVGVPALWQLLAAQDREVGRRLGAVGQAHLRPAHRRQPHAARQHAAGARQLMLLNWGDYFFWPVHRSSAVACAC